MRTSATASSGALAYPWTSWMMATASQSDVMYLLNRNETCKRQSVSNRNGTCFTEEENVATYYPLKLQSPLAVLERRLWSAQVGTPLTRL